MSDWGKPARSPSSRPIAVLCVSCPVPLPPGFSNLVIPTPTTKTRLFGLVVAMAEEEEEERTEAISGGNGQVTRCDEREGEEEQENNRQGSEKQRGSTSNERRARQSERSEPAAPTPFASDRRNSCCSSRC